MNFGKGRSVWASVCVVGVLSLSTVTIAQPNDEGGQPGRSERRMQERGGGGRGGFGGGGGPGGGFMRGMQRAFEPSVTSDQLKDYAGRLSLTPEQTETVELLHEAYQTEFNEAAKGARDRVEAMREEARESRDPAMFMDIAAEYEAFGKERAKMEKAFFEDLKTVFNEEQTSGWTKIERERRREESMPMGVLSGERADVVRLVGTLDLNDEQKATLAPVLDQYQEELDRELVARNELYQEFQGRMREMFTGGGDDQSLQQLVDRGRAAGTRVRDINRRYARQVEQMLPPEQAQSFSDAVKRESFPMVYGNRPYGQRVIDAAQELEGLTESQKGAISAASEQFNRDLGAINARMEKAIEDQEGAFNVTEMRQGGWFRRFNEGPVGDIRRERRELDDALVDKIKALLTPEQVEQLPERRQAGENRRGPMGGEGEDGERPRPRRRGRPAGGEGGEGGAEADRAI